MREKNVKCEIKNNDLKGTDFPGSAPLSPYSQTSHWTDIKYQH